MIRAYGAGQSPRGIRNDKDRPGLIICDDLENDEQAESEEQRDKLRSWFSATLLNTGHQDTNVIVVGTILNQNSLLANLVDKERGPGWSGRTYRAIERFSDNPDFWERWSAIFRSREDYGGRTGSKAAKRFFKLRKEKMLQGTEVLWPQWDSYYNLMVLRETEGDVFFQREKQNTPLDPKQCIFKKENIIFWDEQYRDIQNLIESVGKYGQFYGACDPSLGRTSKSDFTAIVILLRDRNTNIMYVVASDIIHCTPDEAINKIIQYASMYQLSEFEVESNNFQQLMVNELKRKLVENGLNMQIRAEHHSSNKNSRISGLETFITQGFLRFNSKHQTLLQQLYHFPMAKNDDGPDALEMAVEVAKQPRTRVGALRRTNR